MTTKTILTEAIESWHGLAGFREMRLRNKRYTFGDQWSDIIEADGIRQSEADYIRSQGNIPLKNNLIRRLVRNVLGVYRDSVKLPKAVARDPREAPVATLFNKLLEQSGQANRLEELNTRTMEEFLISGVAVQRHGFGLVGSRRGVRVDPVCPANFFFSRDSSDPRGWDLTMAGEVHLLPYRRLLPLFATDTESYQKLRRNYPAEGSDRCRVYEVWRLEEEAVPLRHVPAEGRLRRLDPERLPENGSGIFWHTRRRWRYYFLTPQGECLKEGDSPYFHGSHPYTLRIYPFIDGEVHSFVADIIDQQRYTNRLITLYDWIMRASAKGVLLFPEGALPEDMELEEVAAEWSRFNGVISYRARAGVPLPQQVHSNSTNIGISELLNIQLGMFEDISGVNPALQGKLENNSMSGTLYSQQTHNALTSLRDILETYRSFLVEGTMKQASNILQYHTAEDVAAIAGRDPALSRLTLGDLAGADLDFRFE